MTEIGLVGAVAFCTTFGFAAGWVLGVRDGLKMIAKARAALRTAGEAQEDALRVMALYEANQP